MAVKIKNINLYFLLFCALLFVLVVVVGKGYSGEPKNVKQAQEEPIIINGDTVEYSADNRSVTATGNVKIEYKGAVLTCDKLHVDMTTKDALCEGKSRLEDPRGVIEGEKITYNFQTKTGTIVNSNFRANPYFGYAARLQKLSQTRYLAERNYISTCSFDRPHYRIQARSTDIILDERVRTSGDTFYAGRVPVMYLPVYNHSLKDPLMHVQVVPGTRKEWGRYLLTGWRYNLTDSLNGRIYLDYRSKLGLGEGFGANYNSGLGTGDYKFYYTHENPHDLPQGTDPSEYDRYLSRWRHNWQIDPRTDFTAEYYKIVDKKREYLGTEHNLLKDYFYREYEVDSLPLSYAYMRRAFDYSSIEANYQPRVNRWYSQTEKLPEIKYSMPSVKLLDSPFYYENYTQAGNFKTKNGENTTSGSNLHLKRLDTTNRFSYPTRAAFVNLTPFVMNRSTVYNKDVEGQRINPRSVFYSGCDISTKFYRFFDVETDFLGLNINKLRHIINPVVNYNFNHEPSIRSGHLKQLDAIDSITRSNTAALELVNKLQTKRDGVSVDLVNFIVDSSYVFSPRQVNGQKTGGSLSDFFYDLTLLPYSWLRFDADATYTHSGDKEAANYKRFSNFNYSAALNFPGERSVAIGQRYQRKGGKEITFNTDWRLTPKWTAGIYENYQFAETSLHKRGLREQEYRITRDLHCWLMDVTYNATNGKGHTVWLVFRLKAFPEMEFGMDQSFYVPKSGSNNR